jgi:glycosyltransferase involved in cell wall biosynthesis
MKPKVSVILPSLNVVEYIEECLFSVINQTLKEIEIICVDAGSTDGTLDIIRKYQNLDTRIHLIQSEIKSYGKQMNMGVSAAKGEYVGIVETDDGLLIQCLSETLQCGKRKKSRFC